jgi:hypothetical protein
MSFKSKVFAAAATVTLVGGVSTIGMLSASAATPSCGSNCIDIFSREFGTHRTPNFVMDVWRQGAKVGQPVILFRTSNTDPAEDINPSFQGSVDDFFAAGLVSSAVELHYGGTVGIVGPDPKNPITLAGHGANGFFNDPAFELEYTPFGVGSGLCVGVASTAVQNSKVSLQPCGASSKTVWIVDAGDSATVFRGYVPLVNGSDTNFSHPFVLTYPKNGYPTDIPRPQLLTQNLTGFTQGHSVPVLGTINDNQLWGARIGVNR